MASRCRLCADEKSASDFACTIKDPALNVREMLIDCCRWSTFESREYENLPKVVCSNCLRTLQQCWQFAGSVAQAQRKLLASIDTGKVENVLDEFAVAENSFQAIVSDATCVAFDLQSDEVEIKFSELEPLNCPYDDESADDIDDFLDIGNIKSDDSSSEQDELASTVAEDDSYNEMNPDFILMEHVGEDERRPDGTIAPEAIQRLRLHDWTFVKYCCYICNERLSTCTSLKNHFREEHPEHEMKQFCMLCDWKKSSMHAQTFSRHLVKNHLPYLKHW